MNDTGEGRRPQAASVGHRWWENPAHSKAPIPTAGLWSPGGSTPPPPPPPLPPVSMPAPMPVAVDPTGESALALARQQRLELELDAARSEVTALHEMLEDLPQIFENKFRQRLRNVMEEQQRLLQENQRLRDRVYALSPATPTAPQALRGEPKQGLIGLRGGLRHALQAVGLRRPAA